MTKEIDWDKLDNLIRAGATGVEIASEFCLDDKYFYTKFKAEKNQTFQTYAQSIAPSGKIRIKMKQYEKALNGDNQMLIHVGKHLCDQWEKKSDEEEPKKTADVNLENKVMEQNAIIRDLRAIIEKYGLDVQDKPQAGQELPRSDSQV